MPPILQFIQSKWAQAAIASILFLAATALFSARNFRRIIPQKAAVAETPASSQPSWDFNNPELDQMIRELKDERAKEDAREAELKQLEVRLGAEKTELSDTRAQLEKMQQELDQEILRVNAAEIGNLKKLAKTYAAMDPKNAVVILRELDDQSISKVLLFMRESQAAPILEALANSGEAESRRAAAITERLRLAALPKSSANTP